MNGILSGDPIGAVSSLFSSSCTRYFYYLWEGKRTSNSVGEGIKLGMDKWLKKATGMNQGKPPSSWTDRVQNMYSELNYYKGCNSSINEPVTIYLKSGANQNYLRSDSSVMKFTDKKESFISGWHILKKNGDYPWNKLYKTKVSSGKKTPYTLIGPGYCYAYDGDVNGISSTYFKNGESVSKCAKGTKKYMQTQEVKNQGKYFAFREDPASKTTYCDYVRLQTPCIDKNGKSLLNNKDSGSYWKLYQFH